MCPLLISFPSQGEESDPGCLGLHPQSWALLLSGELQLGKPRLCLFSEAPLPLREELKHWEGCFPLGNLHFLMQV